MHKEGDSPPNYIGGLSLFFGGLSLFFGGLSPFLLFLQRSKRERNGFVLMNFKKKENVKEQKDKN